MVKFRSFAPVAQWTERQPPELKRTVRVCPGVHNIAAITGGLLLKSVYLLSHYLIPGYNSSYASQNLHPSPYFDNRNHRL